MYKYLQKDLEISGPNAQYDTYAKLLLSHKIILAYILIYVAPEFHGLTPDAVVPLIEGEPQVGEISVNPGETNMPVITGTNTENKIPAEGTITYDIHFYVWVPSRTQKIKIIVDVEAQKSIPFNYDIVARGIFYNARQISAQLGREFNIPEYNAIKKVYSIWLCFNVPQYLENTAVEYPICPRNLIGSVKDYGKYDLANVIIINLSKKVVENTSELRLHRLLGTLLSPNMQSSDKTKILAEEYKIPLTTEFERRVNIMCNLSEAILEEGMEKGIEKGMEKGIEKGIEKGRIQQLYELVKDGTFSLEQAARKMNMTSDMFMSSLKKYNFL